MEQDYYLFIYGTERLPIGLDVLEDEICNRIEGQGDVTGSGTGERGWNLDIEFDSMNALNFILSSSVSALRKHGIRDSVVFDLNGRRYNMDELESKLGL